jgi:hypothetical protein
MSIKRMSAVWEYSQHKGSALLLMLAIADMADDLGVAWPGYGYLARKIRMGRDSAIRLADVCHESGELWRVQRSQQRSNMYVVAIGLTGDELKAAGEKLLSLGVRPPTGSRILQPPPQVLEVVGKSYYLVGKSYQVVVPILPPSRIAILPDPSLSVMKQEDDGSEFWSSVLGLLKCQMTKATFEAHLLGSTATQSDGSLVIAVRANRSVEWLDGRLRPVVTRAVSQVAGREMEIRFTAQEA